MKRPMFFVVVMVLGACGSAALNDAGDPKNPDASIEAPADSGRATEAGTGSVLADDSGRADDADAGRANDAGRTGDSARGDDSGSMPPSCVGLSASCGASDCCASPVVPGGTFNRANNPAAPATLASFRLDRYEVTVGRFRRFVTAGGGTRALVLPDGAGAHPSLPGSGWQSRWDVQLEPDAAALTTKLQAGPGSTWTNAPGANEARPMNQVAWLEAFAFCAWDGGRLPTEAELSFALVGGNEQRVYPWSVPPSSSTIDPSYAAYNCLGDGLAACSSADLREVGSYSPLGDGRWGHADLVGNVAEWSIDEWNNEWLAPCTDCARVQTSLFTFRAISGGGDYRSHPSDVGGSRRRELSAFYRWDLQGFRCARRV
jgi:formylglycine-generating enzyme